MQLVNALRNLVTDVRTIAAGQGANLRISARRADPQFALGTYESALQEAIVQNLRAGDVFYDIGANIGFFSLIAARQVGKRGQVYSFEPVPTNAAAITRSARLNGFEQIDVFCEAVAARSRTGELCLARHIGGATLDSAGVPPDLRGRISVDVVAIDEITGPRRLRAPNLVKVDVEGAELEVLQGMRTTLHDDRPVVIYEVDDAKEAGVKHKLEEIAAFMKGLDYSLTALPTAYPEMDWHVAHILARPSFG